MYKKCFEEALQEGGEMSLTGEELKKCALIANCTAVKMHELIGGFGYGKLTADNAVNQLIEAIHNIICLRDKLLEMSSSIQ